MRDLTRRPGQLPYLLTLMILLQGIWLFWLYWHGMPRLTSDAVCFKQPAAMRMLTGQYSIPTYEGLAPYWKEFNSYPAVIYYYLNYGAFVLFGFSLQTVLGVDFVVHFVLATLLGLCMWRMSGRQLPASALILAMGSIAAPVGRPEELGMLLVTLAVIVLRKGTWGLWLAACLLGLTAVTTPGAAVIGGLFMVLYDASLSGCSRAWLRRLAVLGFVSAAIAVTIYGDYIHWQWAHAWEQNRVLFADQVYTPQSIVTTIQLETVWAAFTIPVILAALLVGVYVLFGNREWLRNLPQMRPLAIAATSAIGCGFCLNILAQRLTYDYRHITVLSLVMLILLISARSSQVGYYSPRAMGLLALLVLFGFCSNPDLVRHTVLPLACEEDSVTYQQAKEVVEAIVPRDASVGGDGYMWTLTDGRRPFRCIWRVTETPWPDYLICGTRGGRMPIESDENSAPKFHAEYEEITPEPRLPQEPSFLHFAGWKIPVSRGRCDWYVRIFRRFDAKRAVDALNSN